MKKSAQLLIMAFRNLGRHKIKTILTAMAIAVGILLYVWMDAWLLGMNIDSRRNLVNYETGSAKIYARSYFAKKDEMPLYESFSNFEPILEKLEKNGYSAAPHAIFVGTLKSLEQELPFIFMGVDPEKEKNVLKYYRYTEPPYRIYARDFEQKILMKLQDTNKKNLLLEAYHLNVDENNYYFNEFNAENIPDVQKLNNKLLDMQTKTSNFSDKENIGKLNNYKQKIDQLKDQIKYKKLSLEREYNDSIKNILQSADYYNFVQNGKFEALIGVRGAKDLNVKIGDDVKLYTVIDKKDKYGKIRHIHQAIDLTIAGIINSPNPKTNGNIVYLPLDILQDEMGILLEGHITEICIRKTGASEKSLPGDEESPAILKNILGSTLTEDLILVDWKEDAKDYLAMAAGDRIGTYIMVGLLFLLAVIGIANTMLMAVFERTKEIGMIRAIGMKDNEVLTLFLMESGLIGLIGSVIGILLAIPLNYYMVENGIDYTGIMDKSNIQNFGYRIVGIFRSAWNWPTIFISGFFATFIAAITSYFPARKAIKMTIVDTLRFE